jgi:DNA-binding beta-propeller fold protein YncE
MRIAWFGRLPSSRRSLYVLVLSCCLVSGLALAIGLHPESVRSHLPNLPRSSPAYPLSQPSGGLAAVVACSEGGVDLVDLSSKRIVESISTPALLPQDPQAMAISTSLGEGVILSNEGPDNGAAWFFSLSPLRVLAKVPLPFGPLAATFSGRGPLVVTGQDGSLALVDPLSRQLRGLARIVSAPPGAFVDLAGLAVSPDGTSALVLQNGPSLGQNYLVVVSLSTLAVKAKVLVTTDPGAYLAAIRLDPHYPIAWIADGGYGEGYLFGVDYRSLAVVETIRVGGGPRDLVIPPPGEKAYVINGGAGQGNLIVPADISASTRQVPHTGGTPYEVVTGQDAYLDAGAVVEGLPLIALLDRTSGQLFTLNLVTALTQDRIRVCSAPVALSTLPDLNGP